MVKVLVVEDNPVNMKLAALLLHNAGHTVLCAVDAETGLIMARVDRPDLILMDIQLPGMDGMAAIAILKRDPATAPIPVIALTAMALQEDQERSQVAGCAAYLAKPLRYQDLYAAINSIFGKEEPQAPEGSRWPGATPGRKSFSETDPMEAAAKAIDVSALEALIGNDPVVILEFLSAFRVSAAKIALELKTAYADGQVEQVGRQAHKLKSSARIVGALELGGLCAKMETAGKAGHTETLAALLPLFVQELGAISTFIDTLHVPRSDQGSLGF
jgi:two-component system cell cycle response regulator DivK